LEICQFNPNWVSKFINFTGTEQKSILPEFGNIVQSSQNYSPKREEMTLYLNKPEIRIKTLHFSNHDSKDNFSLVVNPGYVKNSKSEFQIKTSSGKVIYSKTFDSFVFVMRIFEPD
jgi:hypothetical protein